MRCLLTLLLSAAFAAADPSIESLAAQLRNPRQKDRDEAAAALVAKGAEAIPAMTALVDDADGRVQRAAIDVLARIGSKESIKPLLDLMANIDPDIRRTARDAILRLAKDRSARPILRAGAAGNEKLEAEIGEVIEDGVADEIAAVFRGQFTSDNQTGYFNGQFDALREIGPDAQPVLIQIMKGQRSLGGAGTAPEQYQRMAVDALGTIPNLATPEIVEELESLAGQSEVGIAAVAALCKMGKNEKYEKVMEDLENQLDQANGRNGAYVCLRLAFVASRAGQEKDAISWYDKAIAGGGDSAIAQYNLSCSYARLGQKKEALQHLRMSFQKGGISRLWLAKDGDMDPIRDDPEFAKITGVDEAPPRPKSPGSGD